MGRFFPHDVEESALFPSRRMLFALTLWITLESAWIVFLGFHLPRYYSAAHWDVAWVGVDVAELFALAGAVVSAHRRHHAFGLFASAAGTLFLIDAWFDVTTARHGGAQGSLVAAGFEIPFALALWWAAHRATKPRP